MRVGIVGTNWGLMHVGGFRGAGAEVVGLCGKEQARTREIADREGILLATDRLPELCAAVDVVVIASPDALHVPHALEALAAGRHVLVEKPLARTAEEAFALETRVHALPAGQCCAVNFPYRMLPPLSGLRRWLDGRAPVRALDVHLATGFVRAEGAGKEGPLLGDSGDFGGTSHVLDAALWLMGGAPVEVSAVLEGRPVHTVALQARLDTGGLLTMTHRPSLTHGIDGRWWLRGEGWQVELAGGYLPGPNGWRIGPAWATEGERRWEVGPEAAPRPGQREPWAQAHVETARAFLARVRGEEAPDLAGVTEGTRVQRLLDAAVRSEKEGRRVPCGP